MPSLEHTAHLLRRCGYLTTPEFVASKAELSLDALADYVLDESVNGSDDIAYPAGLEPWEKYGYARRWWIQRMANAPAPLQEKLTLFYHGLFATSHWKVGDYVLMVNQNKTMRRLGLGDFEDLAQAIAIDPAMLLYLDNFSSHRDGPNENWAREMMELFLMGVDRGYTQEDVIGVARAWTGHGIDWVEGQSVKYKYYDGSHDDREFKIFGTTKKWTGPETITAILKGVRSEYSSTYVGGRIWGYFAKPKPDSGWASTLGAALVANNWNVKSFLKWMFTRPEFYTADVMNGMLKQPVEWTASLLQATRLSTAMPNYIESDLAELGQGVYEPPSVAGWKQNEAWLNENAVWMKDEIAAKIAREAIKANFLEDVLSMEVPTAVTTVLGRFGVTRASQQTVTALTNFLTAERAAGGDQQRYGLIRMIALSPEFQMA
jgi:uncharacterized protein (DUF1800 family)